LVVNSSGTILTNVDNDYVTANTVLANIVQSPLTNSTNIGCKFVRYNIN